MSNQWILTTLGKKKYPIFISVNNPDYESTRNDIVVNRDTFERNKHRLIDVSAQLKTRGQVYAFKEFIQS